MSPQTIDWSKYEPAKPPQTSGPKVDWTKYESQAEPEAKPQASYGGEIVDAVKRWGSNLAKTPGESLRLMTPQSDAEQKAVSLHPAAHAVIGLKHMAEDFLGSLEKGYEARQKSKATGENWAGQTAATLEQYPIIGSIFRHIEQGGPNVGSPESIGGGVEGALYAVTPELTKRVAAGAAALPEAAAGVAEKVGKLTPKQVAQGGGAVTGAGLGHGTLSIPGAYYGAKGAGSLAEGILGKEFANKPLNLPSRVAGGPKVAPQFEAPATAPVEPASIPSPGAPTPAPAAPRGLNLEAPQTLSGDSALSQILTGQDSANLLKIAKSRGLNVTQETQLRPGIAGPKLIKKIMEDFSPEELEEIRSKYMESTRFRHAFGDIGPEAWKTMSLKTYFPDVKIPAAALKRTESMMQFAKSRTPEVAPQAAGDLEGILQESLKRAKATGQ